MQVILLREYNMGMDKERTIVDTFLDRRNLKDAALLFGFLGAAITSANILLPEPNTTPSESRTPTPVLTYSAITPTPSQEPTSLSKPFTESILRPIE